MLSIASGLGGLDLGLKLALGDAVRVVCHIEREASAAAILVSRMQDGCIEEAPIWDDARTFDGNPWRGAVDIVTAGYPCQPFSMAGKKQGHRDERNLWPEVFRIVKECSPTWVFCENVDSHFRSGFETVRENLGSLGFTVSAGLFAASEVGAPHRRRRLFFLAYQNQNVRAYEPLTKSIETNVANSQNTYRWSKHQRKRGSRRNRFARRVPPFPPTQDDNDQWAFVLQGMSSLEPSVCSMAYGTSTRLDELRAVGNAVVPLVAAKAIYCLAAAIEHRLKVNNES